MLYKYKRMPYNTEYNRMIADELDRINQNKADYMAYSNQVYMNGNKFVGANDFNKSTRGNMRSKGSP